MRSRWAVPVLVFAIALSACGGDDGTDASDTTTTSTSSTSSTVAPSAERVATPHALAYIAVQLDDTMRQKVATADPCLHGPYDRCVGAARDAYDLIDDVAGQVASFLRSSTTKGDPLYVGETPDALVRRMDETMNAAAAVEERGHAAQSACLPRQSSGCDDASHALDDALADLYKLMNQWRADL